MEPNYPIGSVDRALRLMLYMRDHPRVGLSEAARVLETAPSTAHRLFDMLKAYGFADQDAETRLYRPGPSMVDLGLRALESLDLRRETRPYLEELAEQVHETTHLIVLRGADSLFLDAATPIRALHATSRLGVTIPAHGTSGGKAIMAHLPVEAVRRLYPDEALPALTENTIATRSQLERELDAIRERGYAVNIGESEPEIGAVAVVLRDRIDQVRAALTITVPVTRLGQRDIVRLAAAAMEAADRWHENVPSSIG